MLHGLKFSFNLEGKCTNIMWYVQSCRCTIENNPPCIYFTLETGLNPSGIIPVCPGSNPVFNCTTFSVFHEWNVTTFTSDGRAETRRFGVDEMSAYVDEPFNTPTHLFYVTSVRSSNPLMSQLYTRNVSVSFNGTIIKCEALPSYTSVATIHVIRTEVISKLNG